MQSDPEIPDFKMLIWARNADLRHKRQIGIQKFRGLVAVLKSVAVAVLKSVAVAELKSVAWTGMQSLSHVCRDDAYRSDILDGIEICNLCHKKTM